MNMKKFFKSIALIAMTTFTLEGFTGCSLVSSGSSKVSGSNVNGKKVKIGVSFDDLRLERWQHDKDYITKEAKKLGASVVFQSANGNDPTQYSQCENLISQGVNVLIICPHNGATLAPIIAEAHKAGIKVLAYDRMITNCDLDDYISFDNVKVGELQAKAIIEKVPKGNYFLMGGSPTDNNAKMFRQGQMKILQPLISKGDIKVVGDQWVKDWLPSEAMSIMENALTKNNNKIDAVVASNDATAGGAVQALAAQKLDGKVAISGQDADLVACQRVVKGTQTMTIYKAIKPEATKAADIAVAMAKGQKVKTNGTTNNGKKDIPSILLDPVSVNKDNMMDTVIKDQFHSKAEVYQ